jgi:hypothetical protein
MTYQAPVEDIAFTRKHAAGMGDALAQGLYGDLQRDDRRAAGRRRKIASGIIIT